jgi:hypothetical protein
MILFSRLKLSRRLRWILAVGGLVVAAVLLFINLQRPVLPGTMGP